MKAAFAIWEDRIAPVFDVARHLRVVEAAAGKVVLESEAAFSNDQPLHKALLLTELGIRTLVCGAISRPMQDMLVAYGIEVVPFISGEVDEVLQAWLAKELNQDRYAMPGCCGRGRRQGARRGGQGRGRGCGEPRTGAGPLEKSAAQCICPACGHREAHVRGVPCTTMRCTECGNSLIREKADSTTRKRRLNHAKRR